MLRVLARLIEQPRVFDRDGDVRAELAQQHLVDLGELAGVLAQQVERADDAPLAPQRHDELGVRAGHRFAVARIGVDVVDENRLPFGDRGADQPLAHFDAERPDDLVGVADGVGDRQLLGARIQQVDRERLELGDARDQLRDLVQQLVEVQDGRDLATQLEERDDELPDVRGRGDGCGNAGLSHNLKSEIRNLTPEV